MGANCVPHVTQMCSVIAAEPTDPGIPRGAARPGGMSLLLLILFGLGTTLPCVGLWLADERARIA